MAPTTTQTFAVDGMHCGSCGMLIDDTLADLPGVASSTTTFKSGTSIVEVDPAQVTADQVVAAIAEAGYTARLQGR